MSVYLRAHLQDSVKAALAANPTDKAAVAALVKDLNQILAGPRDSTPVPPGLAAGADSAPERGPQARPETRRLFKTGFVLLAL